MKKRSPRTVARKSGPGEIVEVHGGRIVRSTNCKDRHSKVCTAKGTRDRRVRLSANTAIQFYDVQDRLGFDRPSRAVDWLINKAKAAIDELPPWNPPNTLGDEAAEEGQGDGVYGSTNLLPASMESDAIADTIKPSTPLGMQSAQFQSYLQNSYSQDLKLSLQSLQSHQHSRDQNQEEEQRPHLFPEAAQIGFDNLSVSWAENQRLIGWNSAGGNGRSGFMFVPPQTSQQPLLFGNGIGLNATHFFSQREPLQSSNTPSIRAQIGSSNQNYHQAIPSLPGGIEYASLGGFPGFPFSALIRGDQEDHDGDPNKLSSGSSASRH